MVGDCDVDDSADVGNAGSLLSITVAVCSAMRSSCKISGRVQIIWFVRVGLSDPYLPARTLESFCQGSLLDEAQHVSHVHRGGEGCGL